MNMYLGMGLVWASLMSCVSAPKAALDSPTSSQEQQNVHVLPGQPHAELWFKGTVEQAFEKARQDNSLVFLYWGAVWCPPCNELKANVFSKPQFVELMRGFVPVYLDGDTEEAQTWGERLQTSGYPTVLILDRERKELFRLGSSINIEEFAEAIQPLVGASHNFASALDALKKGSLTGADWKILAFADWDQLPSQYGDAAARRTLLQKAAMTVPSSLKQEKALLTAAYLSAWAGAKGDLSAAERDEAKALLEPLLQDKKAVETARSFVVNQAASVLGKLYPDPKVPAYQKTKKLWLEAAEHIEADPKASVDTRLSALRPAFECFRLEQPEGKIPDSLKKQVQTAVALADERAQSEYERHAVISGAAYFLRQVGDGEGARRLLEAELARTNTPWYYQSSLASLELEAGHPKKAQEWSAKARASAQGRATKIQWITNDILLNAKHLDKDQSVYLQSLAKEYYQIATSLNDGFSGRNKTRSQRVLEALMPLKADPEFKKVLTTYAPLCQKQSGESRAACEAHFQQYR